MKLRMHGLVAVAAASIGSLAAAAEPQLAHMVYFTLKEDTAEARQKLVDECHKYLSDHDGTVYFSVGTLAEDFEGQFNDQEFDVALHLVFENKAAHDTYQTHQRHVEFIANNLESLEKVRVFDAYVSEDGSSKEPAGAPPAPLDVLSRLAGSWKTEVTVLSLDAALSGDEEMQMVMGGRFLFTEDRLDPGDRRQVWLATYDELGRKYRLWHFNPSGFSGEFEGTWDYETQTMHWTKTGDGNTTMTGTWKFPDADTREWSYQVKDAQGQVVDSGRGTCKRK